MKEELNSIVNWLNENYNQDSENYRIFNGAKPGVIEYNEHCAISLWACGAIVCIYDQIHFIQEDDGYWWFNDEEKDSGRWAYQDGFSIAWADSFANAMTELKKYVWEHGKPVYFSGLPQKVVCHYCLGGENDE